MFKENLSSWEESKCTAQAYSVGDTGTAARRNLSALS